MASGEDKDLLISGEDIQRNCGESPLKEFLSAYPLELQHEAAGNFTIVQSEVAGRYLHELPARIRAEIWKFLDFLDLASVEQTCTKFRREVIPFLEEAKITLISPFQRFMNILPFIPLHRYLDATTRNTLRLVCRHLKTIMDFYDDVDERRRRSCRWGNMTDDSSLGYSDLDCISENSYTSVAVPKETCKNTTIFDLHIQDLKRIFCQLDDIDLKSVQSVCGIFYRIVKELKAFPFKEHQESFTQLNLMDLPFEVHERLLNFCNPNDRQRLRLVSKLMQFQVDTLAGVEVHLNDLKWGWNDKCGKLPPAYSLIITNMENIQAVRYFTNDENCKLLTRIVLDGKIPSNAFVHLLERCRNLRYVGFTHALQMSSIEDEIRKSFPVKKLPLELMSLRAINLKVEEMDFPSNNVFRIHSWTWANAFEVMKPSLFYIPRLTSFYLCEESIISHNLMYEVAEKVLKFIFEHRYTLKYVSVILNGTCFRSCECPAFPFQMKDDLLKDLKLVKFCQDCDWRISRPFTSILKAQRSLKQLSCFKLSDWEFYAGVIANNSFSLRSVTIEKNLAPVIDLNVFSTCINLEYLWISQYGCSKISEQNCSYQRVIRVDQRLTNLHSLPISLKSLHILDQTVESTQIKTIPQRLQKLEILDLQFLGSWDGKSFGMTSETVSEILQLRKLNCLFLEEIRTLDSYLLSNSFESAILEINLIPIECSQIIKRFGCAVYGILVAKTVPNSEFMPEWQQRVSCYFNNSTAYLEDDQYRLVADAFEIEDEAEDITEGESSGQD